MLAALFLLCIACGRKGPDYAGVYLDEVTEGI